MTQKFHLMILMKKPSEESDKEDFDECDEKASDEE